MGTEPATVAAAYQGTPGAYSEEAAWALVGRSTPLVPCGSLAEMFETVADGRAAHGVLPIENSLAGTVPRAYELLMDGRLTATGETKVRIDHVLLGHPAATVAGLRRVLSHPVALDQCTRFFKQHPAVEAVPVFDTAGAVGMVMQEGRGDTAAIASRRAAALHHAAVLAERIQDHAENWTRFLLVTRASGVPDPSGASKVIVTFRLPHAPGSLVAALAVIAGGGANLTKVESRPIQDQPFAYAFLIEIAAMPNTHPDWTALLSSLRATTEQLQLLGAF